jgi:hypothetical protein
MKCSKTRVRRILLVLWISGVVWLTLGGCQKPPEVVEPPQAPEGAAGVVVDAAPNELALTRTDLPAGFQLAGEKASGPEYFALYLRPGAMDEATSGGNTLLGVLTYVAVYPTAAEAQEAFARVNDPEKKEMQAVELRSSAAADVVSEPYAGAVQGADQSEAGKVNYLLNDRRIFEYSHRVRLGNVLAYMVVSAIGTPAEPERLAGDVRDLVQRQVDRIAAAGSGGP